MFVSMEILQDSTAGHINFYEKEENCTFLRHFKI